MMKQVKVKDNSRKVEKNRNGRRNERNSGLNGVQKDGW